MVVVAPALFPPSPCSRAAHSSLSGLIQSQCVFPGLRLVQNRDPFVDTLTSSPVRKPLRALIGTARVIAPSRVLSVAFVLHRRLPPELPPRHSACWDSGTEGQRKKKECWCGVVWAGGRCWCRWEETSGRVGVEKEMVQSCDQSCKSVCFACVPACERAGVRERRA